MNRSSAIGLAATPEDRLSDAAFARRLGAIALVALLLRLALAERYPLSMDEAFARYWSELPSAFLWGEGRRLEYNPPLYFLVLHVWMGLFGTSDTSVRLPSALASLGPVIVAGLIGRRLSGASGGLLAAVVAGLLPKPFWHALDARPAAFVLLFQAVALWAAFAYLQRADDASFPRAARAGHVGLFAAASLLAVHTHVTAVFSTAALGLCAVAGLLARGRAATADLLLWAGGGLIVILLSVPQVLVFAAQSGEVPVRIGAGGWPWHLQSVFAPLLVGTGVFEIAPAPRAALFALLAVPALVGAGRLRGRAHWAVLVAFPVLYTLMLLGVSLHRVVLFPRMVLIALVPLSVFVAAAVLAPAWPFARAAVAAAVAVPIAVGHWAQWTDPPTMGSAHSLRHEYRAVVRFLATGACAGDVFAGHPWNLWGWPHYGPPPPGSRLYGVRYAEEGDIDRDYGLPRFAARHGVAFIDRAEFLARGETDRAMIVLAGRTARARAAIEADIAALSDRFTVTRHEFGRGNNMIAVHCLTRRGG